MNNTNTIKPIRSREDYHAALARLTELLEDDPAPGTPIGDEAQVLSDLIGVYEDAHFPREPMDPIDFILVSMEEQGLKRMDLVDALGSKSKVSEVLSRKRPLSLTMIRNLSEQFRWPPEVLIGKEPQRGATKAIGAQTSSIDQASPELLKAMLTNGYFEGLGANARGLAKKGEELLAKFFGAEGVKEPGVAYARSSIHHRTSKQMDPLAFRVWQTRVLRRAKAQDLKAPFVQADWTPGLVEQLCRLSMEAEGPRRAVDLFKRNGIAVVIEPHLPRTYLDGAALRMDDGRPVIALTLRYDRLDNFWYTLLHELGHVLKHLSAERPVISDDLDRRDGDLDPIEREADAFASNSLVSGDYAEMLESMTTKAELATVAARCLRGLEVIAGRASFETGDHRRFRRFIGDGKVRALFKADE